jgi:error-prone DNA polymerase
MENRQVIEWDKDDIDVLKFMKVDVLGLGMLGCMRRCFDLLAEHKKLDFDLATVPAEDEATFAMIRKSTRPHRRVKPPARYRRASSRP